MTTKNYVGQGTYEIRNSAGLISSKFLTDLPSEHPLSSKFLCVHRDGSTQSDPNAADTWSRRDQIEPLIVRKI